MIYFCVCIVVMLGQSEHVTGVGMQGDKSKCNFKC